MMTDLELLHRYVEEESEDAFTEIVRRHVDLVYGAALRQLCGNASLAEDITQAVFTALAAKRKEMLQIRHLTAWLYATTRFTVSHTVRTERRRQDREQKAQVMHALMMEPESNNLPTVPIGLLDDALVELDEGDREAVLLRFFEGQTFAAIGAALEMNEDAARMRVTRALERIKTRFAKNGATSSGAAVGIFLSQQVVAAPAHFAAGVAASALAGTAAIVVTTAGTKLGLITFMTSQKTVWIAGTVAALALGGASYQYRENVQRREEVARLVQERDELRVQLRQSELSAAASAERTLRAQKEQSDLQSELEVARAAAKSKPQPTPQKLPDSDAEKRRVRAKKLAQLKPLLEAGMPIKGAVVVTNDGKAVSHPVELVMGKETTVVSDDGIYSLKPAMNPDGSVRYEIKLERETKSEDGLTKTRKITAPLMRQIPWEGFTIRISGDAVLAFDPDLREP